MYLTCKGCVQNCKFLNGYLHISPETVINKNCTHYPALTHGKMKIRIPPLARPHACYEIAPNKLNYANFTVPKRQPGLLIPYSEQDTGWRIQGLIPHQHKESFFSPKKLDKLWGTTQPTTKMHCCFLPWGQSAEWLGHRLTTHFLIVQTLKMGGSTPIPLLPTICLHNTNRDEFTFTQHLFIQAQLFISIIYYFNSNFI